MRTTFHGTLLSNFDYPLEWLDELVSNIHQDRIDKAALGNEDALINRIENEERKLLLQIKKDVFALASDLEIGTLIRRYHSSLVLLLDQLLEQRDQAIAANPEIVGIYAAVHQCIENLLAFVEVRYPTHLGVEERMPPRYLFLAKQEILEKLNRLQSKLKGYPHSNSVARFVMKRLYAFIEQNRYADSTFRNVLYLKELTENLETLDWKYPAVKGFSKLDELLVYMNFNSKSYINLLIKYLEERISGDTSNILKQLLYYQKVFRQLQKNPARSLNPDNLDISTVMNNWFAQEVEYLERSMQFGQPLPNSKVHQLGSVNEDVKIDQKILVMLSGDQIGLIIRAADEARIVMAKSMSEVFRKVVPHLATEHRENLSYKAMRGKSYTIEERDKEIAIQALEKLIVKIREF